jgi:ribosomal protein S18 acetylase RimI-like enzyme
MHSTDPSPHYRTDAQTAHPLDNPIWNSLTTVHACIAEAAGLARRFPQDVTALGAILEPTEQAWSALASLRSAAKVSVLVFDALVDTPVGWTTLESTVGLQMIYQGGDPSAASSPSALLPGGITQLSAADAPEMLALAELTRPGPFGIRTHELGTYLGIRKEGKLIAMAGERLRLPGFTEISAVCTHPDHTGRGHAAELVSVLVAQIFRRGESPFLHVREINTRAIELYLRLGFVRRRAFQFVAVRPPSASLHLAR